MEDAAKGGVEEQEGFDRRIGKPFSIAVFFSSFLFFTLGFLTWDCGHD